MESAQVTEIPIIKLPETESLTSAVVEPAFSQGSGTGASATAPVAFDKLWRVATIEKHGVGKLFGIPVRDSETGEEVLRKLQIRFGKSKVKQYLNKIFLVRFQAVFIGNISLMSRSNLESQDGTVLVDFGDKKIDALLTQALRDPSILKSATDFVFSNDGFTMSVASNILQEEAKALAIGWARTKSLLAWPIFLFSILSIAIGVLIGELAHNAALGVAVTGGVAGVLSCMEVLMVWQTK